MFYSVFLIHCLCFHQIFPTKVNHPSFAGLHLRPMHNLGWDFTAWIFLTLHLLTAAERPRTFWRRPSSTVHGGGAVATARADPSTSTSTAPAQVSKDAEILPLCDLPPSSPSIVRSPSKGKRAKSPSPHDRNPVPPPRVRVWHQGADQGEVDRVHRVHRNRVPGLAVAESPRVGPHLGPKPVQAHDQFTRLQRWSEVLRSSLGMKAVGASMMFHTLLTRRMCPKVVYLCLTSPLPTTRKLANAKRMNLSAEVTPTSQLGRRNESVKAWRA